jgi:alkaline phosphatase D
VSHPRYPIAVTAILALLGSGRSAAAAPPIVAGPLVGDVSPTSARVWVATDASSSEPLTLSIRKAGASEPTSCGALNAVGQSTDYRAYSGRCDRLAPATEYEYRVLAGEVEVAGAAFTTAPAGRARFRAAASSCMQQRDQQPSFAILEQELAGTGDRLPNLQLLLGDNVYTSERPVSRDHFWRKHVRQRSVPEFARVIARVPTFAIWDDHDYGPNNSDGNLPEDQKQVALEAFEDLWPHPAAGDGAAINHTFTWGDVQFFMLDDRWRRDCPADAPDDHLRRMLGQEQLDWLKAELGASTATFKVIANGSTRGSVCWKGRLEVAGDGELRELDDFIVTARIEGVVFLSGDIHSVKFRTEPLAGGYPVPEVISSGIRSGGRRQGFAILEFDTTPEDPGARSMRVRLVNGCGASTLAEAEAFTVESCGCSDLSDEGETLCRDGGVQVDRTIFRSELSFPVPGPADAGSSGGGAADSLGDAAPGEPSAGRGCSAGGHRGGLVLAALAALLLVVRRSLRWLFALSLVSCTVETGDVAGTDAAAPARIDAGIRDDGGTDVDRSDEPLPSCGGVEVWISKQVLITDRSVVEDPVRTRWSGAMSDEDDGAWHAGRLLADLVGDSGIPPEAFVRSFLGKWEVDEEVNGFVVPNRRDGVLATMIDPWPRTRNGDLDLTRAPFRLLAIAPRFDLRELDPPAPSGDTADPRDDPPGAGELRLVFGLVDPPTGEPLRFTMILEYNMPAVDADGVRRWAGRLAELGRHELRSDAYRAALAAITRSVTGSGRGPGRPNQSNLVHLRTNDDQLGPHQMREFRIAPRQQVMDHFYLEKTPQLVVDGQSRLGEYINRNQRAILDGRYKIPQEFPARRTPPADFRGSSIHIPGERGYWNAPGIASDRARHRFSLNTCNGCHGRETGTTGLFHVGNRRAGEESTLSPFLTGSGPVADPVTGVEREHNDTLRRGTDLVDYLCAE